MANAEYEKQAQELANAFTDEELANLAGGKEMTEEQRKKLAKILAITIPSGAVAAVAIGCGTAALVGKFGEHKDAGWYFKHPFGTSPYKRWKAEPIPTGRLGRPAAPLGNPTEPPRTGG